MRTQMPRCGQMSEIGIFRRLLQNAQLAELRPSPSNWVGGNQPASNACPLPLLAEQKGKDYL